MFSTNGLTNITRSCLRACIHTYKERRTGSDRPGTHNRPYLPCKLVHGPVQNIFIKDAKRCRHMINLTLLYTHTARVLQINLKGFTSCLFVTLSV
ncbi:hypothetical protein QCMSULEJ_CDS0077 [Escherichia phage KS_W4]